MKNQLLVVLFLVSFTCAFAQFTIGKAAIYPDIFDAGTEKAKVLSLRLNTPDSDFYLANIEVDLGTSARMYTKVMKTLYVMDGSTVIASTNLNASTVQFKEGRFLTELAVDPGYYIPEGSTRIIDLAADLYSSFDPETTSVSWTVRVDPYSITGVDGFDGDIGPEFGIAQGFGVRESSAIPEPSTYALLLGAGALGLVALRRKAQMAVTRSS